MADLTAVLLATMMVVLLEHKKVVQKVELSDYMKADWKETLRV